MWFPLVFRAAPFLLAAVLAWYVLHLQQSRDAAEFTIETQRSVIAGYAAAAKTLREDRAKGDRA